MKIFNKKLKTILILIILTAFYIFFQYGTISPVSDITGCYIKVGDKNRDKVCLYKSGQYEQFFTENGKETSYNKSKWRSFLYSNDEGEFVAGILSNFQQRTTAVKIKELDIQPHKNTFGKVMFDIGDSPYRRKYK